MRLLLRLAVALACTVCLVSGTAFPTPRGDPDAPKPSTHKHALLEFIETARPLARPGRDWTRPDVKSWLAKGELSSAFGLEAFTVLEVPIFVNVLVAGLDGSGNQAVQLDQGLLQEWMQHLDHIVAHNVLASDKARQGEEDAAEEMEHTASTKRQRQARAAHHSDLTFDDEPAPEPARIRYRYHIRLIHLSHRVISVVERYLGVHYRVENKDHTSFAVDAEIMNGVLEGLAEHLEIDDAYNMFVLNPSRSWLTVPSSVPADAPIRYGYRSGFSNDELEQLLDLKTRDASVAAFVAEWSKQPQADYAAQAKAIEQAQPIPEFTPKTPAEVKASKGQKVPQLQVLDHVAVSEAWAERVLAAPHFTGPQPLALYLHQQQEHHSEVLRASVGNAYAHEDCLVDNWVGRGRSLFVDLSAGPFHWGPIAAGEGVRTNTSFPSVRTFISQLKAQQEEEANEDEYVDAGYDAEAVEAERLVLTSILEARGCGDLPEAERSSDDECRSVAMKLRDLAEWEAEQEHRIVGGDVVKPSKQAPKVDAPESLSFFHDDAVGEGASHDSSLEVDHFLAHLSSTLSSALHHVITPTVGDTHITHGFADQVNFHLYVLVNHQQYDPLAGQFFARLKYGLEQLRLPSQVFTYVAHKLTMDDDPQLAMAYTNALRTSVVPSLLFDGRFAPIKRLYIDSAMLRAQLSGLDLEEKAAQDKRFGEANRAASSAATKERKNRLGGGARTREIPIFMFSLEFPLPVLVDKFYQSRALPDDNMVVAVQSNLHLWESPLTCNSEPMFWNLRDPLRSILSSAAHVLGGLLPLHVKHSAAHGRVAQDWLWSVGSSPLALTSAQGLEFSQIQKDTLHRTYVLTAWRRATDRVNEAVRTLANERTTLANRMLGGIDDLAPLANASASATEQAAQVGRFSARRVALQAAYTAFADTISGTMVPALEQFQFDAATQAIASLYTQADDFVRQVNELVKWNRRDRCAEASGLDGSAAASSRPANESTLSLTYHWYLLTVIACLAVLLYRLLHQRDEKPKLN